MFNCNNIRDIFLVGVKGELGAGVVVELILRSIEIGLLMVN